MTQVDIAPRSPGWYPDPRGASATRFWDGSEWTQHVKGGGTRLAPPAHGTAMDAVVVAPLTTLPRNGIATSALLLGIASLLANVLLVPSILAVVLGGVGLVRARRFGGSGRSRALAGVLLGPVGVLAAVLQLALLLPILLGLQHDARLGSLRSTVISQAAAKGVPLRDVTCPHSADLLAPAAFTCDALASDGRHVPIAVTVTVGGAWTWRTARTD